MILNGSKASALCYLNNGGEKTKGKKTTKNDTVTQ